MSWFTGKQTTHSGGHKSTRIDPATGRNKRDNLRRESKGWGSPDRPRRRNGRIEDRAAFRRAQKTRGWFS